MPNKTQLPENVKAAADTLIQKYSESEGKTTAGKVLRFFAHFISVEGAIRLLSHVVNKKSK